jgi:hypothetical protein
MRAWQTALAYSAPQERALRMCVCVCVCVCARARARACTCACVQSMRIARACARALKEPDVCACAIESRQRPALSVAAFTCWPHSAYAASRGAESEK